MNLRLNKIPCLTFFRHENTQDRKFPPEYEGHFDRILIPFEEIVERAKALAELIHKDYKGKRPVLLCVLKGANPVSLDLSSDETKG